MVLSYDTCYSTLLNQSEAQRLRRKVELSLPGASREDGRVVGAGVCERAAFRLNKSVA